MAARMENSGRRTRRGYVPMSDINVTPFVDVMLVLLVVFMITAPLLSVGVPVDLPDSNAKPLQGSEQPLTITVDAEARVWLQETEVPLDELVAKLTAIVDARGGNREERIFVRGDRAISYGNVMQVMGTINEAGFRHVALVTEKPKTEVSN
jgi:biopolymer transport protein TolR